MSFFRRINDQFNEAKGWKQHLFLIVFYSVGFTGVWFLAKWFSSDENPLSVWGRANFGLIGDAVPLVVLFAVLGLWVWIDKRRSNR